MTSRYQAGRPVVVGGVRQSRFQAHPGRRARLRYRLGIARDVIMVLLFVALLVASASTGFDPVPWR